MILLWIVIALFLYAYFSMPSVEHFDLDRLELEKSIEQVKSKMMAEMDSEEKQKRMAAEAKCTSMGYISQQELDSPMSEYVRKDSLDALYTVNSMFPEKCARMGYLRREDLNMGKYPEYKRILDTKEEKKKETYVRWRR